MPDTPHPALTDTTIAFINNFAGPGLGGGEVQLVHMLDGAIDAGMDVHLIAPPKSGIARVGRERGALVTELELRASALPLAVPRLRRILGELEPRIVQGTGFLTNQLARAAAPAGARVVSTVHVEPGAPLRDGGSKAGMAVREIAERAAGRRADAVVAVSQAIADALVAKGTPAERVRVIHNGVDAQELRAEAEREGAPEGLEVPPGTLLVGVLARLEPVKGVADFLQAASRVPAHAAGDKRVQFVVAGEGSEADRIRQVRDELGLADRVMLPGRTPSAAGLLAACDLVVVPSLSEGFGIVAAEAMALGKPVVATRVGGLPEVVLDGVTGLLVPPGDPGALADAIALVLDDPARAVVFGEAGRERVEQLFTVERMISEYLELYGELVAG